MKDDNISAGADLDFNLHRLLSTNEKAWHSCTLGPPEKWPLSLTSYATTLAAFPYPAALLWGDEYILLHNKAWSQVGGSSDQGQPRKHAFTKETLEIVRDVERLNIRQIHSHDLSHLEVKTNDHYAILSPLQSSHGNGIMIQLMPKPVLLPSGDSERKESHSAAVETDDRTPHDLDQAVDNTPIDEHPFFKRFAEMIPSGLAILDRNAQAIFVNQNFFDLTTTSKGGEDKGKFTSWPQSIHDDDYDSVMDAYQDAFKSQKQLRTEFRAKGATNPWRLLLLTPLGDENLQHVSLREYGGFVCSIVDISNEKAKEESERKAAKQASERKEQQERFIDMISHEIRNPLSAVLHCAEDISDAINKNGQSGIDVKSIRESVDIIHLCVTHQKNIVDDVLSFSKLDASMLSLAPKPSEPKRQLQSTLQMFQHEFRKQRLEFQYSVDDAYDQHHVSWVMADLARISQVLINLVTNAIKFTHHDKGKKLIHCSVAASTERPTSYPPDVVFFEGGRLASSMDVTDRTEWGDGSPLYIMVAVRDNGIGISQDGQKRLFERFQQATPKTEEVYGGSGLGLNISRKICHLHGGEIGVSSKEGDGSTFGFFFKVRKTATPKDTKKEQAKAKEGNEEILSKIKSIEKKSSREPIEWSSIHGSDASETATAKNIQSIQPSKSKEHGTGDKQDTADTTTASSPTNEEQQRDGKRAHVLLVEDNVINQKILHRKLEAKGFAVTTANNGQEAIAAVQADKGTFDVILMDKEMPILDGNGATQAIRELERKGEVEHIPILGVTANVRGAQQDEMLSSGMDDVISKPYRIEDMVTKINQFADIEEGGRS